MSTKDDEIGDEQFALSLLSPEERAAMADDDEIDTLKSIAGEKGEEVEANDDDDGEENQDDDNETDDGADEDEGDTPTPTPASAPTPAPTPAPAEAPAEADFRPAYNAEPVADYAQKLAALDAGKADAFQKLMDGEINAKEYAEAEAKYQADREVLTRAQTKAELAAEMQQQNAEQQWRWEVSRAKREAKAEGIDYDGDQKLNRSWDNWVKTLAADPENGDKDGSWFLKEATRMVKLQFNVGSPAPTPAPAPTPTPTKKPRTPDLSKVPPSLAKVPAAEEDDAGSGGEFAHLSKLKGMDYENAIARMTPEQQERWAAES